MNHEKNAISDQLAVTAGRAGEIGLASELVEFAIDETLDSGVLKDIPFVGWIAKGLEIGQTISDRILFNKILRFLTSLESISSKNKSDFQSRVAMDHGFRRRVGEHLLTFIDRLDDLKKTDILAACFDHFLTGDIEHDHFIELSSVIDRLTSRDLEVIALTKGQRISFPCIGRAVASGVLEYGIGDSEDRSSSPSIGTRMTDIGHDLRDIALGEFRGRDERRARTNDEMNLQLERAFKALLAKSKT